MDGKRLQLFCRLNMCEIDGRVREGRGRGEIGLMEVKCRKKWYLTATGVIVSVFMWTIVR